MKLWHKLMFLWIAVALIDLVWGAAIILGGGMLEDVKAATYPLNALVIILITMSVFAMAKDRGWFQNDERTQKTGGLAFMYAYVITMIFLAANALLRYYDRKGDVKFRTDKDILKFFVASMGMALAGVIIFVYVSPYGGDLSSAE